MLARCGEWPTAITPVKGKLMSGTVNGAMIGLGFGAEFLPIYAAHPNANISAICRRDEAALNKSGDQFGIEKRYTSYDDVLADSDIDFVHINSPIPDHAWMSLKALDAGKHVMCTVPMATTIDECRQIVEKVKETGLKYMMAETVVYSREYLFIKEMYENSEKFSISPRRIRRTWTAGRVTGKK
jgi:predicted dehydrogenase